MTSAVAPKRQRDDRIAFYIATIAEWLPRRDQSVLVIGAEQNDLEVFQDLGFTRVTLLNLGGRHSALGPGWSFVQGDGHALPFPDASFDAVVAHATLHHCRRPHAVVLEMYRVAKRCAVFIEARDSFLMRLAERFGFTQSYEVTAVHYNDGRRGGVDDTAVPNYIYRWTERDLEKTIATFAPHVQHRFHYRYGVALPQTPAAMRRAPVRAVIVSFLRLLVRPLSAILGRQGNLFGAKIDKPEGLAGLHPWLTIDMQGEVGLDRDWAHSHFQPAAQFRRVL
jgi:SAM-dependent methyltransferase